MLHESYELFYEAEEALYAQVEPEDLEAIKAHVQVLKDLIMCNLHWR